MQSETGLVCFPESDKDNVGLQDVWWSVEGADRDRYTSAFVSV